MGSMLIVSICTIESEVLSNLMDLYEHALIMEDVKSVKLNASLNSDILKIIYF